MRISVRSLGCGIMAFAVGLTALLGLLADLLYEDASYFLELLAQSGLNMNISPINGENGFEIFDFKSEVFLLDDKDWVVILSATFSIAQCIVGVAGIIVGCSLIVYGHLERAAKALIFVILSFLAIYTVLGIIYCEQYKDECEFFFNLTDLPDSVTFDMYVSLFVITTRAYFPLIFGAVFAGGFFICVNLLPDIRLAGGYYPRDEERIRQRAIRNMQRDMYGQPYPGAAEAYMPVALPPAYPAEAPLSDSVAAEQSSEEEGNEEERIELIKRYARLLEEGAIDRKEFDTKKKQLLGL